MANRELPKPPFHASPFSPLYRPNRRKANAGHIEEQREKLTQALFNSEKQYNTLLHSLTQHYVVPLSTSPIITANQHKLLFHELNTIQGLSDNFLSAFQHRRLPSNWSARNSKLSDLLNAFVPFFAVYKTYANHLQFTSELIQELSVNKKWIIFTQKAQIHCQSVVLSDLLLLPAEQIVQYDSFLSDLVKTTNPTHTDYVSLKATCQSFNQEIGPIEAAVNEYNRKNNIGKIEAKFKGHINLSETHRAFICEGKLWKISARNKKHRLYQFFLFNDLLIYASSFGNKYKIHNMLPINDKFQVRMLKEDEGYGSDKNGRIFSIQSEKKSIVVYAENITLAQEWVRQLKQLSTAFEPIHVPMPSVVPRKLANACDMAPSETLPVWVPDSHVTHCKIKSCNTKFSFTNRKHHCRKCGAVICGKCSKYKILNHERVAQRACKTCYILHTELPKMISSPIIDSEFTFSSSAMMMKDSSVSDDSYASDFENEIQCLYVLPYYIETAEYQGIFDKFGNGIGSYMVLPSSIDPDHDQYYNVNLVVQTESGFESFKVSLFEKQHMVFRLESKTKDFDGMDALLGYLEVAFKIKFSYPILRVDVERTVQHSMQQMSIASLGYPKAQALYEYESKADGDLTFKAGDIICVWDTSDENGWWSGFIEDRLGIFPSNYVQLLSELQFDVDDAVLHAINTMNKESSSATIKGEGRRRNDGTVIEHSNSDFSHVVLNIIQDEKDSMYDDVDHDDPDVVSDDYSLEDMGNVSATQQFFNFLKRNGLEKYFEKFKENECCSMRDCEYLLGETDFLKDDIGIKNPIHRKKLLGELAKLKYRMDEFKMCMNNIIPEVMVLRLLDFGIVTMDILCNQVKKKSDIRNKLRINNNCQCNLLWNIIQMQINPKPHYTRSNDIISVPSTEKDEDSVKDDL
eukprot:273362_1